MRYGTSLYGRFLKQTSTGKMASKKTFHLRYKEEDEDEDEDEDEESADEEEEEEEASMAR